MQKNRPVLDEALNAMKCKQEESEKNGNLTK